jgi:hypothetical protein
MTRSAIFAAAVTAAFVPAAVAVAAPEPVRGAIIFLAADRNGDGAVDLSEADSFRGVIFDAIDVNQDGRLTPQEVGLLIVPNKEGADQKELDKLAKRREEQLAKLDLAKPEGVPKDEYLDRNAELFAKADADKDSKVTPAEFTVIVEAYGVLMPK